MNEVRAEYDFSDAQPNPYGRRLKKAVTIRLDVATIDYFKALALKDGIPYQTLMNMYLSDCASHGREPDLTWH